MIGRGEDGLAGPIACRHQAENQVAARARFDSGDRALEAELDHKRFESFNLMRAAPRLRRGRQAHFPEDANP